MTESREGSNAYISHAGVAYALSGEDNFVFCSKIRREFAEEGCSCELEDWLRKDGANRVWLSPNFYYRQTVKRSFWLMALETYINTRRDTPSRILLWRWAKTEHRNYRDIEGQLAKFGGEWVGDLLLIGGKPTSEKAFSRFFNREIATKPVIKSKPR